MLSCFQVQYLILPLNSQLAKIILMKHYFNGTKLYGTSILRLTQPKCFEGFKFCI